MGKIFVALEPELIARCYEFGEQMIAGYACGRMTDRRVYAKANKDARLQALSKMGECAFTIFVGRSPDDLDWFGEHKNGEGHDLALDRYLFDIKHTENGRLLIWPVTKIDKFWTKDFNCLALTIGAPPSFEIAGIVGKTRFYHEKQVAEEGNFYGLSTGTWFMERDALSDPSSMSVFLTRSEAGNSHEPAASQQFTIPEPPHSGHCIRPCRNSLR